MVYNWDEHRDECYRVYVVENKSMDELMQHMRIHQNFTPSKRAYQQQLRKWNFPSKQVGAHRNAPLVDRVRQLWEANHSQAEMLRVLHDEGYDVSARQLLRLRAHHRWLLRVPKDEDVVDDGIVLPPHVVLDNPFPLHGQREALVLDAGGRLDNVHKASPSSSPTRKRRRQVDNGCLAGAPSSRFPSETTLAESKGLLGLDNDTYKYVRMRFQQICEEAGLEGKTSAGQAAWNGAKALLVQQVPYLRSMMPNEGVKAHSLALDVICADVTKRMRSQNAAAATGATRKMTLADVRNMLGVNPDEARMMREALQNLLPERYKISTLNDDGWDELRRRWKETCPVLRRVLEGEEQRELRIKAVEMLARDVVKRYKDHVAKLQDKQTRVDHEYEREHEPQQQQQQLELQLQPRSTLPPAPSDDEVIVDEHVWNIIYNNGRLIEDELVNNIPLTNMHGMGMSSLEHGNHIAPPLDHHSLLLAASTQTFLDQQYMQQVYSHQAQHRHGAIAIYLQPHHASTVMVDSNLWIGTLASPTLDDVRASAVEKYPGAVCLFVEGVVKDNRNGLSNVSGLSQVPLPIGSDQELDAYLQHVHELGVAPTFSVQLHY